MDILLKAERQMSPSALLIPSTSNYISMFRIDGEPILPPLMTTEKRYEMQMYREKAIQLERKILAQQLGKKVQFTDANLISPRSHLEISSCDSASQLSIAGDDNRQQSETEKLFSMPFCFGQNFETTSTKLFTSSGCNTDSLEETPKTVADCSTNTVKLHSTMQNINDRMKNLHKSKTIIFDHTLCTIVKGMTQEEIALLNDEEDAQIKETIVENISEIEDKSNINPLPTKKLLNLPLNAIPSICVNPPTPLAGPSNICDLLSATESVDSFDVSCFHSSQATQNQVAEISEDNTDDSSFSQSADNIRLLSPKKVTGITARILQYKQLENASPSQGVENEEEKILVQNFAMRPPQRSATSPSLKSITDATDVNSLTPSPRTEEASSSQSLIRSSSFTLEGPSKALLDHIRQQKTQVLSKSNDVSPHSHSHIRHSSSKRRGTPSPSAWRDTVESKAKRVQKKLDMNLNSRPTSSTRSKSKSSGFNNYHNPTTQTWSYTPPQLKVKRSPYDAKSTSTTPKTQSKPNSGNKIVSPINMKKTHLVKKAVSNTTYTVRQPMVRKSLPNNSIIHSTINDNDEIMSEIESRHRQRLITLIAQQQEEQRRLQHAFETQQSLLLEQLNNEMSRVHIDGQQLTPTAKCATNILHIEDGLNGQLIPPYNGNSNNGNVGLVCSPPTLSVTSSYVSPGIDGALGGFTTTTTVSPCETPLITSPQFSSSRSPTQRRPQVGISTGIYPDNISHSIDITTMGENMELSIGKRRPTNTYSKLNPNMDEHRNAAATIINAHARGFLIRRLFQTEQIQRIVQTIRDTLIFVLNLHMETLENDEEANTAANIKLKARLLQQLASASRTLHLIFFQTNTRERMEIISRDRKRIKTKLLTMSMKRSPRIV